MTLLTVQKNKNFAFIGKSEPFSDRGEVSQYQYKNKTDLIFHKPSGLVGANCFIWFKAGSRYEKLEGLAHLVEHLIFQKESTRIKNCIEKIERHGGELNACTTKEYICFELSILSNNLDKVIESFFEMVFMPDTNSWNVSKELKVIAEELREDGSDPSVDLGERVFEKAFSFPLGHRIGGKISNIKKLDKKKAMFFYQKYLNLAEATICLISNEPEEKYLDLFSSFSKNIVMKKELKVIPKGRKLGSIKSFQILKRREVDGCFLNFLWPGSPITGKYRLHFSLLDTILCSGLGGYLFEELRTKRSLIYGASSGIECFSDNGLYEIELFCSVINKKKVRKIFLEIWKELYHGKVLNDQMLESAKNQVINSWSLELDDIETRNSYLARGVMFRGEIKNFEELCQQLRNIDLYDMNRLLKWLGPVPKARAEIVPKNKK